MAIALRIESIIKTEYPTLYRHYIKNNDETKDKIISKLNDLSSGRIEGEVYGFRIKNEPFNKTTMTNYYMKLGETGRDVDTRIREWQTKLGKDLSIHFKFESDDHIRLEKLIHLFMNYASVKEDPIHLGREWFYFRGYTHITSIVSQIDDLMKKIHIEKIHIEEPHSESKIDVPTLVHEKASRKININTATYSELHQIKYIKDVRSKAIIDYRSTHGNFHKIEDIMRVKGIKEGIFNLIKNSITI